MNRDAQDEEAEIKYEDIHFVDSTKPVWNYSLFTEEDLQNFQEWYALQVV